MKWHFRKHDGYDDVNASTAADSFNDRSIKDLATAIIREGVQNAMDARRDDLSDDEPVRVRLTLAEAGGGEDAKTVNERWFRELFPHLELKDVGAPEAPKRDETCELLIFEDFGTTGLTGDYRARYMPGTKNNFVNFMFHEGVTGKGDRQRGSRGVGKIVFTMASRARTLFALTVRENENFPLLVGKNLLKFRLKDGERYRGSSYFLADWPDGKPREPITDPATIEAFIRDFPVSRQAGEPGLSVVIPFLDASVTAAALREAVVAEYHYAILAGKLEVTIDDHGSLETFDTSHLPELEDEPISGEVALARWALSQSEPLELTTLPPAADAMQQLESEHVPEEVRTAINDALDQHQRIAVRMHLFVHPKGREPEAAHFDVYLEHAEAYSIRPTFIRELLPVSDVRTAKSAPHVRALVVINEGPLADLLRSAEGANHTDWSPRTDRFKERYRGRLGEITFVAQSVSRLISIVRGDNQKPIGGIATRFFSAKLEDEPTKPGRKPSGKGKERDEKPTPDPKAKPKRYTVDQTARGFVIRRGEPGIAPPKRMIVRVAYDVVRGSAWNHWDPADFDFSNPSSGVTIGKRQAKVDATGGKGNRFTIEPEGEDFEVSVIGFDPNRDLKIEVTPDKGTGDVDTPELHEPEEAVAQ